MRILVIDDYIGNIASARLTLKGQELITASTVVEAVAILKDKRSRFDAVLTDLFMPLGGYQGTLPHLADRTSPYPVGLVFAIKAVNKGIKAVICTDANHHEDEMTALLSVIGYVYRPGPHFTSGDAHQSVSFVEARSAPLWASWDEGSGGLAEIDDYDDLQKTWERTGRIIKNWATAMRRSGLFPEVYPISVL